MFRLFVISVSLLCFTLSQEHPSIHQEQLEYYNSNYILPERSNESEPIAPITPRDRDPSHEVFGYHPYWMGTSWTNYNFDIISTLAYFSAEATATGELVDLHGWPVNSLINEAHVHGGEVVLCLTLFSNS